MNQGLLRIRQRVEFAHPARAVRDVLRRDRGRPSAGASRARGRRRMLTADPDRRAWHRAQATRWPDEDVAAELERSADRAQARGGLPAAAAFLTRAAELTPQPSQRIDRALQAALANVQAGAFDIAHRLLTLTRDASLDESQQARIDLLDGQLALASSRGNEAAALLLAAAKRLEPFDVALARDTYLNAFTASLFAARLAEAVDAAPLRKPPAAYRVRHLKRPQPQTCCSRPTARSPTITRAPRPNAAARSAASAPTNCRPPEDMRWLWHGVVLALEVWDDESAYALAKHHVETARTTGALSELALALSSAIPVIVFCGDTRAAASAVAEAESVQHVTGIDCRTLWHVDPAGLARRRRSPDSALDC